ncbi:sugar phosphate isomerase/epimerase [Gimesia chilikensis]|uniref:sugar phosphate isomerase/epimerase family protein n=1 Tax=Gimesia chilikensis TaxID=2605989 RepID=UPI0011EC7D97|nr:sugar phosphate isomerase/epimerase family protein [Gimesia chilikensis]KAA0140017.1 sugar phosphate isomerase/epimerase [Gimesia chilikensis]
MSAFRFSLNASTIRTTPLLDKIRVTAEAGYGGIELWFDEVEQYLAEGGKLETIAQALKDGGLAVPTMIMLRDWWSATEEEYPRVFQTCLDRIKLASQLGAEYVIACPHRDKNPDYDLGAKRYRELLEAGIEAGAKPAVEFLGFVADVTTIEDALRVVEKSGHPAATLVLDPFHVFRGGGSMETIAQLKPEQIAISHFNDAVDTLPRETQMDPDRVLPGDGHLDLVHYCRLLKQIGYEGWLSLELFREDLWQQDPLQVAQVGLERMQIIAEHA